MEGCTSQLETLKGILNTFTLATGLKVNFSKSMMVPINLSEEKIRTVGLLFWLCERFSAFHISWITFRNNQTQGGRFSTSGLQM